MHPAARRPTHQDALIFLHVPKTAGTVLKHVIGRLYAPEETLDLGTDVKRTLDAFATQPASDRARIRAVHGHAQFGAHALLPRAARYVTLLRDPLDRVLSFYYYVARRPDHYHFEFVSEGATSPRAFVESGISTAVDNFAVRLISGAWHDVDFGALDRGHLATAKRNIEERFAVAGTQEEFDLTLCWIAHEFGWHDIWYVPLNATSGRPARTELAYDDRRAIEAANALDLELYAWVSDRMRTETNSLGLRFRARARTFAVLNPGAGRLLRRADDAQRRGLGPRASTESTRRIRRRRRRSSPATPRRTLSWHDGEVHPSTEEP